MFVSEKQPIFNKLKKTQSGWIVFIFVACILVLYLQNVNGGFISDDLEYVKNNQSIHEIKLSQFWRFFTTRTNPNEYLPLRDLSYVVDIKLGGDAPIGYHLHNIVLYGLICYLVWLTSLAVLSVFDTSLSNRRRWIAAIVTMLFASHPVHVEAVAWISGRKDLLCALFSLLAVQQFSVAIAPFTISVKSDATAGAVLTGRVMTERHRTVSLLLTFIFYLCALLSKSASILLPFLLLLLACCGQVKNSGRLLPEKKTSIALGALFILMVAFLSIYLIVGKETEVLLAHQENDTIPIVLQVERSIKILGGHVSLALLPVKLSATYELFTSNQQVIGCILGVLFLVLSLVSLFCVIWLKSVTAFGVLFFCVLMVPFLQLIPFDTWSMVSDRFLFLPVLGICLSFACLLQRLPIKAQVVVLVIILTFFTLTTNNRVKDWNSSDELFIADAHTWPQNYYAKYLYINSVLLVEGKYEEAIKEAKAVNDPDGAAVIADLVHLVYGVQSSKNPQYVLATIARIKSKLWQEYTPEKRADIPYQKILGKMRKNVDFAYRALVNAYPNSAKLHLEYADYLEKIDYAREAKYHRSRAIQLNSSN